MKLFKIIMITLIIIFTSHIIFTSNAIFYLYWEYGSKLKANPKEVYMLSLSDDYDEGDVKNYYLSKFGKEKFQQFLIDILKENMDLRTLADIAEYSDENTLCNLLPYLEERKKYLQSLPSDTSWIIRFSNGYGRIYSNDSSSVSRSYFRNSLNKLKLACSTD